MCVKFEKELTITKATPCSHIIYSICVKKRFQDSFQSQEALSNVRIVVTSSMDPEIGEYLQDFVNKDMAFVSEAKKDVG